MIEHKQTEITVTSIDESQGIVEAIWALMGNRDSQGDVIHPGAFKKTFTERGNQVKLLDNHRTDSVMSALGTVEELREVDRLELPQEVLTKYPEATGGAWGRFKFLLDTPEGVGAFLRIKNKVIQSWSFGYDAIDKDYSNIDEGGKKTPVRNLRGIRLWEVSPVLFPANEGTTTTGIKSQEDQPPEEEKAGRVLSARNATRIKEAWASLHQCLTEAGLMEAAEEIEEASKDNGATGPQKSDVPPTSDSEAGPAEDDSTRQIIELELQKLQLLEV